MSDSNWFSALFDNFWDQVLTLVLALLVCLFILGAFWVADVNKLNPAWAFLAWNSIMMIPLFIRNFRGHLKRPAFKLFLVTWMVVHGVLVVGLMRWIPIIFWIPLFVIEFYAGYIAAYLLFGVLPSENI